MRLTLLDRTRVRLGIFIVCAVTLVTLAALPAAAQSEQAKTPPRSEAPPQSEGTGQSEDCPGPFAQVDVTVDPESDPLLVEPDPVEIHLNPGESQVDLVCWVVTGLAEGQTLHIEGKEGQPDLFPNLQRTIVAPRDRATSGAPSAAGSWMYSLWITEEGSNEKLHFTDPEVIVRGDG